MERKNIKIASSMEKATIKYILFIIFTISVISSQAQRVIGKDLFPNWINNLELYGVNSSKIIIKKTNAKEFNDVLYVNTYNDSLRGEHSLIGKINSSLSKGDVIWVSFKARTIESKRETGEAFIEFRIDQLKNGINVWPPYLERGISFGSEWTEMSMPFVMPQDANLEDLRLSLRFDTYPQKFEIGSITILNCGKNVNMDNLPRTIIHYEGDKPDSPWRKEAAERIEKYRKGDLEVKVVDANGKPIQGAKVKIKMKKNAFYWGTAINSESILDSTNTEFKIYRDTLQKYFNLIVFENEMKSKVWGKQNDRERGRNALLALRWLREHNIAARGHVMVWPSWQHSPHLVQYKDNPEALRQEILNNIDRQTNYMYGQFIQWDVVNEPYAHHDILDILGKEEMVKWFKYAHERAPGVKLFLNDYTMFQGDGGVGSRSECFYNNIQFLLDKNAPIDAIGEQAHIGGTPPGISKILERLNKFAKFGLPIYLTEFDINSNDDEFKARYIRDIMTVAFSHPSVEGVIQWGFWAGQHWCPYAALWNEDWTIRKHGAVFTDLISNKWWSNFEGETQQNGVYKNRGFCGEYEINVEYKGQKYKRNVKLNNKGLNMTFEIK